MDGEASTNAIEVTNLTCGYGSTVVLQGVSFSVRARELFFVIGGSGCGKSTHLRCMIGLLKPTQGEVTYSGRSLFQKEASEQREILKSFGVLYQNNALWTSMTLSENLSLPLEEYTTLNKKDRDIVVALKLAQVGLSGSGHLFPSELSGGMKKRAALARALALDPSVVFFDEPSEGLDPITSRAMDRLILRVRDSMGTTMVIVSHQLSSILRLADRAIFLESEVKGILAEGKPSELAANCADARVREFLNQDEDSMKPVERVAPPAGRQADSP